MYLGFWRIIALKPAPLLEVGRKCASELSNSGADLMTALNATLRYCPVLATEPEKRLAAIVDFTFNLGAGRLQTSTLRRRINQRDWHSAGQELRRWVYGGGKVLPGLVTRREAEATCLLRAA